MHQLHKLCVRDDDRCYPIPEWGLFFLDLGLLFSNFNENNRVCIALSIPTRAFAAVLAAVGIIVGLVPNSSKQKTDKRFKSICALQPGVGLTYVKNGRRLKAVFDGVEMINGEKRIRVKVQQGKRGTDWELISKEKSLSLIPTEEKFKIPQRQTGYQMPFSKNFIESVLPPDLARQLVLVPEHDCLIIGSVGVLKTEILDTTFTLHPKKRKDDGNLQDLLRVKSLVPNSLPFRSDFCSATNLSNSNCETPTVVIFDGANGFLNLRGAFPISHWLVLLDRTEKHYLDAVQMVNQEYVRRKKDYSISSILSCPDGVEITIFGR